MNLRRTWTILLIFGNAPLLASAPGAIAKPGYFVFRGGHSIELDLKGSNGYGITITKQGRYVYLLASEKDSVVVYVAPSLTPKRTELKARFPGVGRVSMRFQPQGPPHDDTPDPFPGCKGGDVLKQSGHFVGGIRFRGERGYTSARATRVRAVSETRTKEVCKRSDGGSESERDRTELFAFSRSGKRVVAFDASQLVISDFTAWTTFGASVREQRQGMAILRSTFAEGKAQDIAPDDTRPYPLSGTVTPPAPFQGSGEFQRDAEGNGTWTAR